MTPRLAPVAFEDLTVPRATEGGKSARQGKAMEDKGKGKAEEGQDTYGDRGSSGRGGGRGQGRCWHGKQPGKCRECRGEGEAAGWKERGREDPETQRERVLFIGTQFSILYTFMHSPIFILTRVIFNYFNSKSFKTYFIH